MRALRLLLLSIIACSLLACVRGESKTLSEVVTVAKTRFAKVQNVPLDEDVKKNISSISRSLEDLVNNPRGGGVSRNAKVIAGGLNALLDKASYTNRPAMGEILGQYLDVGSKPAGQVNGPAVKLLAARTYTLLASELETRRFSIG